MSKQRILVLSPRAPWLHEPGFPSREGALVEALSRSFAVDVVTCEPSESCVPPAFARRIDSYAALRYTGRRADAELREFVADRLGRFPYAAIHAPLAMHAALPKRDVIPVVYDARAPQIGTHGRIDGFLARRLERQLIARAALVVVASEREIEGLAFVHPAVAAKAVVVPDAVEPALFAEVGAPPGVPTVLVADDGTAAQRGASLRTFERAVLPLLRERVPSVRVILDGDAPFPQLLAAAAVVAVPSSRGAARIAAAWWSRRPVVASRAAASGVAHERNRDLFVADDAERFALRLADLFRDGSLSEHVVRAAVRRARRHDPVRIAESVLAAYSRFEPAPRVRIPTVSEEFAIASRS